LADKGETAERTEDHDKASTIGIERKPDMPLGRNDYAWSPTARQGQRVAIALGSEGMPQQSGFEFTPSIWVGPVPQVESGQVMNSAILSDVSDQISLLGITSAALVKSGCGLSGSGQPFQFSFINLPKP